MGQNRNGLADLSIPLDTGGVPFCGGILHVNNAAEITFSDDFASAYVSPFDVSTTGLTRIFSGTTRLQRIEPLPNVLFTYTGRLSISAGGEVHRRTQMTISASKRTNSAGYIYLWTVAKVELSDGRYFCIQGAASTDQREFVMPPMATE